MIRVAVIMGKMHSGGKKNLVMEYYRNIDRNKIQFDFICDSDSNAIPTEEIESLGGRVYIVAPYQHIFKNLSDIKKIIQANKYQIVHGYNGTMNVFSMFIAKCCGVPIRINESISMAHKSDKKTYIKNVLKPFSKCFCTHYMANGEECGRWQFGNRAFEEGKVEIFKTVINTEKNNYDEELRDKVRYEFGLQDSIVIGHIGRLTEQKNTLFIIDIFNQICKKECKAKLLVIGDGNLRNDMLRKIHAYGLEDKVLYLGRREDIHQFYNAMDCFLLPSLYEGLPVVGVEAECHGLTTIYSTEVPKESSISEKTGIFLALEKSPSEWADVVIQETKKNMVHRIDQRDKAKKKGFDSAKEGRRLQNWYEAIVEHV